MESQRVTRLAGASAAILAGGLGTRLRPVLGERPKVLARVGGRPFLEYLLDQLADAGVRSTVLCTGHKAEAVIAQFGASYRSIALCYSREPFPLGTGGAVREARLHLESDPALLLNGDSYCHADLAAFLDSHRQARAAASILLAEVSDTSRFGRVHVDGRGAVTGFEEKASEGGPGWINAGVYLLSQEFLWSLPESSPLSIEREVFPAWIGRGLHAYRCSGWFIDIGTPESYAAADQLFTPRRET